ASGRPQQESEKLACRLINAETVIHNSCAKLIDLFRKSLAADDDRVCGYPRSAADELNREYLDLVFQNLKFKSHGVLGYQNNFGVLDGKRQDLRTGDLQFRMRCVQSVQKRIGINSRFSQFDIQGVNSNCVSLFLLVFPE